MLVFKTLTRVPPASKEDIMAFSVFLIHFGSHFERLFKFPKEAVNLLSGPVLQRRNRP